MKRIDNEHEARLQKAAITTMNRKECIASYRALLDQCQREGRDLTSFEQQVCDSYQARIDVLDRQPVPARGIDQRSEPGSRINSDRAPLGYRDEKGDFVKAIGHRERIQDSTGPAPEGVCIGELLRCSATGKWDSTSREMASMSGSVDASGGIVLNAGMSSRLIDLARNKMVTLSAGVQTLQMPTRDFAVPEQLTDATAYWRRENLPITLSDPSFGITRMSARTLGVLTSCSVELLEDSPLISQALENSLAQSLALEMDRCILRGAGATEPLGLRYWNNAVPASQTNINTIDKASSTWTFDDIILGAQYVEADNHSVTGIIVSPATLGKRRRMKDGDGQYLSHPYVDGLDWYSTSQVPSNLNGGLETELYLGDFREMVLGVRTEAKLEIFRSGSATGYDATSQLGVFFRAYLRCDVAVLRAGAFCVIHGALTA